LVKVRPIGGASAKSLARPPKEPAWTRDIACARLSIEAMRDVGEQERELLISTRHEPDGVSVGRLR
jgi:hypothetical protein